MKKRRCNYQGRNAAFEGAVRAKPSSRQKFIKANSKGNYSGLIGGRQPTELANADSKLERPKKSQDPVLIGGRQPIELANGVHRLFSMSLDRIAERERETVVH